MAQQAHTEVRRRPDLLLRRRAAQHQQHCKHDVDRPRKMPARHDDSRVFVHLTRSISSRISDVIIIIQRSRTHVQPARTHT